MFESMPPWLRKAWGRYLREAKHWEDKEKHLKIILINYFGIMPPEGEAEKYAMALAQKLNPLGRPPKNQEKHWEQLKLDLDF